MTAVTITQITPAELQNMLEGAVEKSFGKMLKDFLSAKQAEPSERLLTIKEAADYLKISVSTIYGLTSSKHIPFMKKGKRLYFSEKELLQFVKDGKQKTVAQIEGLADQILEESSLSKTVDTIRKK